MKPYCLLLLRIALGLLMVWWGLDKLVSVEHAVRVSDAFYAGLFSSPRLLQVFGVVQSVFGVLVMIGLYRRWTNPGLTAITGVTLISVWRSIVDPWGWMLSNTNVLFYPSLIVFAAALVLMAFRDQETLVADHRGSS